MRYCEWKKGSCDAEEEQSFDQYKEIIEVEKNAFDRGIESERVRVREIIENRIDKKTAFIRENTLIGLRCETFIDQAVVRELRELLVALGYKEKVR